MSNYLRRGLISAIVCLLVAVAFQYSGSNLAWFKQLVKVPAAVTPQAASKANVNMVRAPVIALSHGGGPMPIMGDANHKDIIYSLKHRVPKLLRLGTPDAPQAIVLVTAHWTTSTPIITSSQKPGLYYDYYGFPKETYSLKYDAPGSPSIAEKVKAAMEKQGLEPVLDSKRDWDHGVFVPMTLVNPKADIPIVQVSVLKSEDPAQHFAMGRALETLRDENIAIIGSGFASMHNLAKMGELMMGRQLGGATPMRKRSDEWNTALTEAVSKESAEERAAALAGWRQLPHADEMHPKRGGEHFLPLLVCAAAGGEEKTGNYKDDFIGIDVFTYYWGNQIDL